MQIVNQSVKYALNILGYTEDQIQSITKQIGETGSVKQSAISPEHYQVFACATGELALSPQAHLKMMAAVQPFISGAISKTVNLPAEATIQDVSATYREAWSLGLKAVAIYRDGSKFVQPLSAKKNNPSNDEKPLPLCGECGYQTILESGCYRCRNCGTTTACAS